MSLFVNLYVSTIIYTFVMDDGTLRNNPDSIHLPIRQACLTSDIAV